MNTETSLLDTLREAGADRTDPVRFRYLESLERRLRTRGLQHGPHWQKLELAAARLAARVDHAEPARPTHATSEPSPLSGLLDLLNQSEQAAVPVSRSAIEQRVLGDSGESGAGSPRSDDTPRPLKAMARVKSNQGAQALQARIHHAINSTPKEAGPMNGHRLVSRALTEMQRLSPAYLNRFARYTDTLLALERLSKKG